MNEFWAVPKLWKNETVVIIGSCPSSTQEQVDYARGKAKVIAINDNYLRAPWADLHYFCDPKWYDWHKHDPEWNDFAGIRVTFQSSKNTPPFNMMRNDGVDGLCRKSDGLRTGRNSGYQCVNLAYHLGVKRIILIGFDMKPGKNSVHYFGNHPSPTKPTIFKQSFLKYWPTIAEELKKEDIKVINCTIDSDLNCFTKENLGDVL